jgi:hypothetical protein
MPHDDNDGFYEPGRGYPYGDGYTHRDQMTKREPWWARFRKIKTETDDDDVPPTPRRG